MKALDPSQASYVSRSYQAADLRPKSPGLCPSDDYRPAALGLIQRHLAARVLTVGLAVRQRR